MVHCKPNPKFLLMILFMSLATLNAVRLHITMESKIAEQVEKELDIKEDQVTREFANKGKLLTGKVEAGKPARLSDFSDGVKQKIREALE